MIFIPEKNIWTPDRKWGMPKFQKGVLHPAGFWAAAGGQTSSQLTSHSFTIDSYSNARGLDLGADYWPKNANTYGALVDRNVNGRTVDSFYYFNDYQILTLGIAGTGHANTDSTFYSVFMNTTTRLRSAANSYNSNLNGGTIWTWNDLGLGTSAFPWLGLENTYTFIITWK